MTRRDRVTYALVYALLAVSILADLWAWLGPVRCPICGRWTRGHQCPSSPRRPTAWPAPE